MRRFVIPFLFCSPVLVLAGDSVSEREIIGSESAAAEGRADWEFTASESMSDDSSDDFSDESMDSLEKELENGGFQYEVSDEGVTITRFNGEAGKVTIPDGVTHIGIGAFAEYDITSVEFPGTLKRIEAGAFVDCVNLKSVFIPASVEFIGIGAFSGVENLNVQVSSENTHFVTENGALYSADRKTLLLYFGNDEKFTIPEGVTSISGGAFYFKSQLETLEIPASTESIHALGIFGCENLQIKISEKNEHIKVGDGGLFSADGKTLLLYTGTGGSYEIPEGVTAISDRVFYGCKSLVFVTVPDGVTSIGKLAFADCENLRAVVLPGSVTEIGEEAFVSEWSDLVIYGEEGDLAQTHEETERYFSTDPMPMSFLDDSGAVYSPDGKTLFEFPKDFSGVYEIPEGVTSIAEEAFYGCEYLTFVKIPESVTSIGRGAFVGCAWLSAIVVPASVTSIDEGVFDQGRCSLTIYGKKGSEIQKYVKAFVDSSFDSNVRFSSNPIPYCDASGVLYSHDGKTLLACPKKLAGKYVIPSGVKKIEDSAFSFNENLTSVTIPHGVTSIEKYAFSNCERLQSLTVPASVTSIGEHAFAFNGQLESVKFRAQVSVLETGLFYSSERLKSIEIPSSVKVIRNCAFMNCDSLTSVTIPDGVQKIEEWAFMCSNLKSVSLPEDVQLAEEVFDPGTKVTKTPKRGRLLQGLRGIFR